MEADLEFLQISCFLYEFRSNKRFKDDWVEELSKWLQSINKLKVDVEYDTPLFITSLSPNLPKFLDIINMYSPDFPLMISVSENQNYMLKKLDFQCRSHVTYKGKGVIYIPCFHGGYISVDGKIESLDLLEMIKVSKPVSIFTTSIKSNDISINDERVSSILSELYAKVEHSDDDDLHQFTLKSGFSGGHLKPVTLYIRIWKICAFVSDNVFHIKAQKNFVI